MTLIAKKIYPGHFLSHALLGATILTLYLNGNVGAIMSTFTFFAIQLDIDKAMTPLKRIYLQNVNFYGHSSQGYTFAALNTLYDSPLRLLFRFIERKPLITDEDRETIKLMMPNFGN